MGRFEGSPSIMESVLHQYLPKTVVMTKSVDEYNSFFSVVVQPLLLDELICTTRRESLVVTLSMAHYIQWLKYHTTVLRQAYDTHTHPKSDVQRWIKKDRAPIVRQSHSDRAFGRIPIIRQGYDECESGLHGAMSYYNKNDTIFLYLNMMITLYAI